MSKPRIVVDRIEGAFAVLEVAGQTIEIPAAVLPPEAGEGTGGGGEEGRRRFCGPAGQFIEEGRRGDGRG